MCTVQFSHPRFRSTFFYKMDHYVCHIMEVVLKYYLFIF